MKDKSEINTSERLFDLVRYMRGQLYEAELIDDREYFWLCSGSPMANSPKGGSPSRKRLEEYDEMRETIKTLKNENSLMLHALQAIEERFVDGENTHDDWQFMGETAKKALDKLPNPDKV
jgi:hypothetical protein